MIRISTIVLIISIASIADLKAQFLGCRQITQITTEDCTVLEKLFMDTDGYNWFNIRGWLVTNQPCDWYGITCESSAWPREIIHIDLSANNLTGVLPGDLALLTELQSIRIDNTGRGARLRKLISVIPPSIGDLEHLEVLMLGNNAFTGTIPPELGDLTNLRELSLSANQLLGPVPESFGKLINLQHLDLHENRLGGHLPDTLQNLLRLEYFNLSQNLFIGTLPAWTGKLDALNFFDASQNQLSGTIPEELIHLDNLFWLSLADNDLEGALSLPTATFAANIQNCNLQGNRICLPDAPPYANLDQVCSILPQSECKVCQGSDCMSLESVYFETEGPSWTRNHGWLANADPCTWHGIRCHDQKITSIILPDNGLTGVIPRSLSSLQNLEILDLSENTLQGSIPDGYTELGQLKTLDLSSNELTGILSLPMATLGAQLSQCNLSMNAGICVPNSMEYATLNVNPICQLPLRGDCLGYDFIAFSDLNAIPGKQSVKLIWSAILPSTSITFVVERTDPLVSLAEISGSMDAPATFTYTVNDLDPGQHSFQIRQIAANGLTKVTESITVVLYPEDLVTGAAYPNPFTSETSFEFTSGTHGSVSIELYDLVGRRIRTLFSGTPPLHSPVRVNLNSENLSSGVYFVRGFLDGRPVSSQQILHIQ